MGGARVRKDDMQTDVKKKTIERGVELLAIFVLFVGFFVFLFSSIVSADPVGFNSNDVTIIANETAGSTGYLLNVSGGRIVTLNITGSIQNSRWKGFVGYVSGSYTLDDSSGSTIYDWSLSTTAGEVYATTNSSTISWTNVACASITNLENQNTILGHTNADDNITKTFNGTSHDAFTVAGVNFGANDCGNATTNTYVENATQDHSYEEIALFDSDTGSMIFTTIMENDTAVGFDSEIYDFQMIVPESTTSDVTAYYLYVELS